MDLDELSALTLKYPVFDSNDGQIRVGELCFDLEITDI